MKIAVVQPLLPHYSIAFFNRVVELHPDVELVVLADLETSHNLNQYSPEACKFGVVHLRNMELRGIAWRPGMFRLLRAQSPDVVVFSGTPRDFSQIAGLVLYRLLGRKVVVWGMFHRIGGPGFVSSAYFRLAGRIANRCITYTRIGASHLISLGVSKQRIGIVGTAIDERVPLRERAARTPQQLAAFRREQGLEGKHVVLQVVRLSRIKRPELLILAAQRLLEQRRDVVFVLIGNGEMREELEQMAAERGVVDAVRFLGPVYDEEKLSYWYMNADVFVVPTCIGLSAHHAMCYGVPIVTDDSLDSQASEFSILADGINCLIYEEGSCESLANAISRVIAAPDLRQEMGRQATRTIEGVNTLANKASNFVRHICSSIA